MYVRLAFAVAAHLEPEILLVDEVLAVGDAEFQRRCLGRMEDLSESGRTVLFVSHNMQAVAQLCDRAILLDGGRVVSDGPSAEVVARVSAGRPRQRVEPRVARLDERPATSSCGCARRACVQDGSRRRGRSTCASRSGSRSASPCCDDGEPVFPKIKVFDRQGDVAFNALDTSRAGRSRPSRATTSRPRGSRRTC